MAKASKSESVTRIKTSKNGKDRAKKQAPKMTKITPKETTKKPRFLSGFFGYFVGAWQELRQVHWPTRSATWGLTGAVLAFSAFFVVFILVLDAIFKYIFETILK